VALRRAKQAVEPVPTGPPRVLVVNDEHDACELLVRILRRAGNEVERARDFEQLADRLVEAPPLDGIVLDVAAGGIGGNLKLLDGVRGFRDERIAMTPIVLVTMASNSAMFSWQAGVDELLVRPFHADELVAAVRAAVTRPAEDRPKHRRRQLEAARASGRR
jgi:two-component system OmpR family response regulator